MSLIITDLFKLLVNSNYILVTYNKICIYFPCDLKSVSNTCYL